jgi:peptidoglycan/xylan/chitin deacetylase (PgdA/CDA1 family)
MSDDGYANTLTVAADILQSQRAPWSLFVSTRHIETQDRNPMFLARLFLAFAPKGAYRVPHFEKPIKLGRSRDRTADETLDRLKSLPADQANAALAVMLDVVSHDADRLIARFRSESFLSWADVRALKDRNVEIGAHAHVHWPMHSRQTASFLREQAEAPKKLIEANVGACRFFAYPFGNVNDVSPAAVQAVKSAGYEYAFTTLTGSIEPDMNPHLLPRYTIGPSETLVSSVVPLLRAGNARVRKWQRALGG